MISNRINLKFNFFILFFCVPLMVAMEKCKQQQKEQKFIHKEIWPKAFQNTFKYDDFFEKHGARIWKKGKDDYIEEDAYVKYLLNKSDIYDQIIDCFPPKESGMVSDDAKRLYCYFCVIGMKDHLWNQEQKARKYLDAKVEEYWFTCGEKFEKNGDTQEMIGDKLKTKLFFPYKDLQGARIKTSDSDAAGIRYYASKAFNGRAISNMQFVFYFEQILGGYNKLGSYPLLTGIGGGRIDTKYYTENIFKSYKNKIDEEISNVFSIR